MKASGKMPCTCAHACSNEPAMKRDKAVLNDLPGQLYTTEANEKIPDNCKYQLALIQAAQNKKQTSIGGLVMQK